MIKLSAAVVRAGTAVEIALRQLAPGDIVTLSAGDTIPADVRIIEGNDLTATDPTAILAFRRVAPSVLTLDAVRPTSHGGHRRWPVRTGGGRPPCISASSAG